MKRLTLIILVVFVLFAVTGIYLKTNQEELNQNTMEKIVNKAREKFSIPAVAVVVFNSESMLYQTIKGVRIVNTENAVRESDFFHIGSCSKYVLSLIAGKTVERGLIQWNTPFFEICPQLKEDALKEYHEITLEDLLLCEAGIQPFTNGAEIAAIDESIMSTKEEFARHLFNTPPCSELKKDGSGYHHLYSNASYVLASLMLENITGKPYQRLVHEALTENMRLSFQTGWPNILDENQPWGHAILQGEIAEFAPDNPYKLHQIFMPAGDLSMKAMDFASLIQMQLQGLRGKNNYLTADTYHHISFGHNQWSLGTYNNSMFGHVYTGIDGSAGTFYCRSIVIPESDFAFIIMTNLGSEKAINWISFQIAKYHYGWWWIPL